MKRHLPVLLAIAYTTAMAAPVRSQVVIQQVIVPELREDVCAGNWDGAIAKIDELLATPNYWYVGDEEQLRDYREELVTIQRHGVDRSAMDWCDAADLNWQSAAASILPPSGVRSPVSETNYSSVAATSNGSFYETCTMAGVLSPEGGRIVANGSLSSGYSYDVWNTSGQYSVVYWRASNPCETVADTWQHGTQQEAYDEFRASIDPNYVSPSMAREQQQEQQRQQSQSNCDPNYSSACVPTSRYDVNCADVGETDFFVSGSDIYNLDADNDYIACES